MYPGIKLTLVTGATGWLGQNFVPALARGTADIQPAWSPPPELRIRTLILPGDDRLKPGSVSDRIEVIRGDIREAGDCARFCANAEGAVLFHAAAVIHPRRVRDFFEVNVKGTENILDAAIAAGVRRAVVVSSNAPCGFNPHHHHLFDEESPYRPYRKYGRSKMQMELAVKQRQQRGDIETVIIRAPWFYGPHQPSRQTLFFKMVRDGRMPIVGGGDNRRSMVYIDNLVQGLILAAITNSADGKLYWIADERPYTMNEIVDTVERLLQIEFAQRCVGKRRRIPGLVSEIAGGVDWLLQNTGLHHRNIHVLAEMNKTIACSIAKARRELGYRPKVGLEEGLKRAMQHLAENSSSGGFLQ